MSDSVVLLKKANDLLKKVLPAIRSATRVIHFQFYIVKDDSVGSPLLQALMEAARRGVRVNALIDAFGSSDFSQELTDRIRASGVNLVFFRPLLPWKRKWGWGTRLHRKVIAIDGQFACVGGINLASEYCDDGAYVGWLDFAVAVEGDAAYHIHVLAQRLWKRWAPRSRFRAQEDPLPQKSLDKRQLKQSSVQPLIQHWYQRQRDIYSSYIRAMSEAKTSAVFVSAYFFPNRLVRRHLKYMCRRGVRVELILSRTSDVWLMKMAARHLYSWLMDIGATIYEWQPSNVHAKVAVVDQKWSTVGSFNLDAISTYGNLEMNVNVTDPTFCTLFTQYLQSIIKIQCVPIKKDDWDQRHWTKRVIEWCAYRTIRFFSYVPMAVRMRFGTFMQNH